MSTMQEGGATGNPALDAVRSVKDARTRERDELVAATRAIDVEIRNLVRAERALCGSDNGNGDGHVGGTAIEAVERIMREVQTTTQSTLVKRLGKPKNTIKNALEVLTERGVVEPTGRIVERSPEFAIVKG